MKRIVRVLFLMLLLLTMLSACNEGDPKDESQLEPLLAQLFLAPNEAMEEAQEKALSAQDTAELESYLDPFFEEYVSADYLRKAILDYSTIYLYPSRSAGKSHLEEVSIQVEEGSETKGFTARVFCENSAGETETLEIKGTFRHDEDGKITNLNFSTGMSSYSQYFG